MGDEGGVLGSHGWLLGLRNSMMRALWGWGGWKWGEVDGVRNGSRLHGCSLMADG